MTDIDVDADIARMVTRRRTIQTLGFSYYETNHRTPANTTGPRKPQRNRASRAGGYQFKPGYLTAELDLLSDTLTFAHAGLDVRGAA